MKKMFLLIGVLVIILLVPVLSILYFMALPEPNRDELLSYETTCTYQRVVQELPDINGTARARFYWVYNGQEVAPEEVQLESWNQSCKKLPDRLIEI